MKCALLDGLDRIRERIVRRQHDHRQIGMLGFQFAQHIEAVGIGQSEIEQHEIRFHLCDPLLSLRGIRPDTHVVAVPRQHCAQRRLDGPVVINDHDGLLHGPETTRGA